MRAVKNGIFFFLLSKILAVDCKTTTNSVQFNGQNSGAPNSWIGQPVTPEATNYYNSISPYPPQSTYLNNNNNQQPINYGQPSPMPQPYNMQHHLNTPQQSTIPQQFIPQEQNFYQTQEVKKFQPPLTETPQIPQPNPNPMLQIQSNAPQSLPPGSFNSNSESGHQQPINMQYPTLNQNVNTEFKQPVINQNNENQQSLVSPPYNLPPQGGQGASQSFGTIKPSPPNEYQKQPLTSLDHPIPEELPDFGESPDFGQVMNNDKKQENKPEQVPSNIVPQLSQQTSFNSKSDIPTNTLLPPTQTQLNLPQLNPSIPSNSNTILLPQIPSQFPSNPPDKVSSTPNENTMDIKDGVLLNPQSDFLDGKIIPPNLLPQAEIQLPLLSQSSLELLDKGLPTPSKNTMEVEYSEPIDSKLDIPNSVYLPPTENQLNLPQSSTSVPPISNQVPSPSSSELLDKGPPTPNTNTMQDTNDGVSLNSISGFPDSKPEPLISNVVQNENILIDNSQTDMQTFLEPENNKSPSPLNNVSENQDDSPLELNDTPPQLLTDNTQVENVVINNPQQDDSKKDISLNEDAQKLQNALNESPLPANVIDTQLKQEPILEKTNPELPVVPFKKDNELFSLENLVFDEPLDDGLRKYDQSLIVDTENLENIKQNNGKNRVFANPNDVHTLLIAPTQSSTSDNSYPNNNNLLNSSPTNIPWYNPSFSNIVDYVQQPYFNAYNQLLSTLLNVYQNPLYYNQIPMYPSNNNYYNQPNAYSAVGQNQMSSKIKLPSSSLNDNQPSSKDNSGCIYKKVDLRNPPPNISNSWLLSNKDYTKNSNPNDGYTSYDGKTSTSIFGTPSMSYQNNNQGIINFPLNDMSVYNFISMISESVHIPFVRIKAIFDVTRANFPRAQLIDVIRLTYAVVQSAMRSLQQTLDTVRNTLYGRLSKRDFSPSGVLHNLPGALIDKYSQQSTTKPTAKDTNIPYYTQPDKTGQQSMQQQQQTYYGGATNMNYYGSQDYNNNIGFLPQPVNTQNYVFNALVEAITAAIRSNVPDPYSIDTPEVKEYTHQVIVTVEIVFKNQIDNVRNGRPLSMNV
ncbi:eukaryotic translation initiation factor 4 gamma-like isoform X2 [Myzus persicae]|uniref:eukaryotic translation initiation factor 4 gamma-like isoform X2 n=1 Tax=Myzus persicae TaxID=13164 RepID=UPI000B937DC4|nr:eukaryotic translation initiation factor 4 gamma-like isoform X2 [Myzus persicae]